MDTRKRAQLNNPQALFNLIRILQEYLISKNRLFALILLPFDILISLSLLLSFIERVISYKLVRRFMLYIFHDLSYVREIFMMIVRQDYVSEQLTEKVEEKDASGTAFKHVQKAIKFLWSVFILLLTFPILPVLYVYDYLAPRVLIGFLYYLVIFYEMHIVFTLSIFIVATFLVASTTVPVLFSAFVYIKSLFELKKRTFHEIRTEADTLFLKLYAYNFETNDVSKEFEDDEKVEGGLYYLSLKLLHSLKDIFLQLCIKILKPQRKEDVGKLTEIKDKIVSTFQKNVK